MTEARGRRPEPHRYFEDLAVGETRRSRSRTVTAEEILDFARQYDPQWFHSDAEAAKESVFGELVASGIHTAALWRQLDHEINGDVDFVCGVGWDNVRWSRALRAGDTIHVTSEIISKRPSETRDDRGIAIFRCIVVNQDDIPLLSFDSINLVYTREGRKRAQ